jgi:hypothetical protein
MLIPTGIILGTGVILSYCTLTGNWRHWIFLWLFEVWIVVGSVVLPIWLARRTELACKLSRPIAWLLSIASLAMIVITAIGVVVIT